MATFVSSPSEAVEHINPTDSVVLGLGPAHPVAFLHALGERDDWVDLNLFGALLTDLYSVFTKPGVRYRSGFFGPAERFLRDSGANIEYVPADFRRFAPIMEAAHSRVMATAAAPPDEHGYLSLSLHAGALGRTSCTAAERDPDRLLVVEYVRTPTLARSACRPSTSASPAHRRDRRRSSRASRQPVQPARRGRAPRQTARSPSTPSAFIPDGAHPPDRASARSPA